MTEFDHAELYKTERMIAEIHRLQSLVAELLPFMANDVRQAMSMGPAPVGHVDDCEDCVWYRESLVRKQRIEDGEFDFYYPQSDHQQPDPS